eukprot:TRINITY_DN8159_c0_g1_i4.p1 TRINITY_DN8159_c0_g1~~TRINITY_DN8159_c0_g1_i4.p1  ORF type:complete len:249 (+),score=70.48 TRINITY_DN8159_c0_g1_i4:158-904(+)
MCIRDRRRVHGDRSQLINENKEIKDPKIIDDKSASIAVGEKAELPFDTIAAESVIPFEQKEMVDNPESVFHRDESSAKTKFDPQTRFAETEMEDPEQFQPRQSALLKQKDKMISKSIKQEGEIAPAIFGIKEEDHSAINPSDLPEKSLSQPFKQEEGIFVSSAEKKDFLPSTFNPNSLKEKNKYLEEKKAIRPSTLSPETHIMFKTVSYTHLRAHETSLHLVCRLLLEKKKKSTFADPFTVLPRRTYS